MDSNDKSLFEKTQDELSNVGDTVKSNRTTIGFVLVSAAAVVGVVATAKAAKRKYLKAKTNRAILKSRMK